jgi:hypothetical protein
MDGYAVAGTRFPGVLHGDVNRSGISRQQLPQLRGTVMAKFPARATCLHSREPATLSAERSVSNGVDAAMEAV